MRLLTTLLASLAVVSAQLPAFSRQAWDDSLSPTPTLLYSPVQRGGPGNPPAGNTSYYKKPTSAITAYNISYPSGYPTYLDTAPIFDPLQYRFPDVTFNTTLADGYPRAWHIWFPKNYKKPTTTSDVFTTDPSNKNKFNIWYALHGFTDNAFYPYYDGEQEWPGMPIWSNLTAFTYHNNYILVAPAGVLNAINISPNEVYPEFAWNAGLCCTKGTQDDVSFLVHVRNNITATFAPKKQFLTGFSNGGFMVNRMACERRDLWDAFLSNAAPVNINGTNANDVLADCDTRYNQLETVAKPILLVHGRNDERVNYQGSATSATPSALANFQGWGRRNGCPATSTTPSVPVTTTDGLTSTVFFNTFDAKAGGYSVFEYPNGLNATTFRGDPKYFGYNRLPFVPTSTSYTDKSCATVEFVSHYDSHKWPKAITSVADDFLYRGNGVFDLNEYAHIWFERVSKIVVPIVPKILYTNFDIKWLTPSFIPISINRLAIGLRMRLIAVTADVCEQTVVNIPDIVYVNGTKVTAWHIKLGFTNLYSQKYTVAQAKSRFIAQLKLEGLSAANINAVTDNTVADVVVDTSVADTETTNTGNLITCADGSMTTDTTCITATSQVDDTPTTPPKNMNTASSVTASMFGIVIMSVLTTQLL